MNAKDFYNENWNFKNRSKVVDKYVFRHTTDDVIAFAEKYYEEKIKVKWKQTK